MWLYILILGITVTLGFYLGNAWEELSGNAAFAALLPTQTFFSLIMNNIITITIAAGALSIIIVFSKFTSLLQAGRSPPL